MRAFKPHSLIAWFVALKNSFKDHIIGSRLFRFHPEHLRTTYVREEADDWPTFKFCQQQPHSRKQSKHNKRYITNRIFFIIQGKDKKRMSSFKNNVLPTLRCCKSRALQDIRKISLGCAVLLALRRPLGHLDGVHLRPPHLATSEGHAGSFDTD